MAENSIAEGLLETEGHASWSAANATGEINVQGIFWSEVLADRVELLFKALACDGISGEESERILVIDEESIARCFAGCSDGV